MPPANAQIQKETQLCPFLSQTYGHFISEWTIPLGLFVSDQTGVRQVHASVPIKSAIPGEFLTTPTAAVTPAAGKSEMTVEETLAATQPPGTVIKCVTAQVIQTDKGPRIVLQGLQGADFTQTQMNMVQQQVKQQLLKGEQEFGFDSLHPLPSN